MVVWRTGVALAALLVAGCLGGSEGSPPLEIQEAERGVAYVSSNATAKFYEFHLRDIEYQNQIIGFAVTPIKDAVVAVEVSGASPRYSHAPDCLAVSFHGEDMRPAAVPGAPEKSSRSSLRDDAASLTQVFWTYEIDRIAGASAAGQDLSPGDYTPLGSPGDAQSIGMSGAWRVGGGTDFVLEIGGRNDAPDGPTGNDLSVNVTVFGAADLRSLPPRDLRCGAGLYGFDDEAVVAQAMSSVTIGGRILLETQAGSTLIFNDHTNLPSNSGRLLFPGQNPVPFGDFSIEYARADNVTGVTGFEIDAFVSNVIPQPYWLVADAVWPHPELHVPI